jgi:hypothetical protein
MYVYIYKLGELSPLKAVGRMNGWSGLLTLFLVWIHLTAEVEFLNEPTTITSRRVKTVRDFAWLVYCLGWWRIYVYVVVGNDEETMAISGCHLGTNSEKLKQQQNNPETDLCTFLILLAVTWPTTFSFLFATVPYFSYVLWIYLSYIYINIFFFIHTRSA